MDDRFYSLEFCVMLFFKNRIELAGKYLDLGDKLDAIADENNA